MSPSVPLQNINKNITQQQIVKLGVIFWTEWARIHSRCERLQLTNPTKTKPKQEKNIFMVWIDHIQPKNPKPNSTSIEQYGFCEYIAFPWTRILPVHVNIIVMKILYPWYPWYGVRSFPPMCCVRKFHKQET